jgi:hypothetical protein
MVRSRGDKLGVISLSSVKGEHTWRIESTMEGSRSFHSNNQLKQPTFPNFTLIWLKDHCGDAGNIHEKLPQLILHAGSSPRIFILNFMNTQATNVLS